MVIHGEGGALRMGGHVVARLTGWQYSGDETGWQVTATCANVNTLLLAYPARRDLALTIRGHEWTWRGVRVELSADSASTTIKGEGKPE